MTLTKRKPAPGHGADSAESEIVGTRTSLPPYGTTLTFAPQATFDPARWPILAKHWGDLDREAA